MKRLWLFLIVGLALVAGVVPAQAAVISNLSGQSCGDFSGVWHFVNNQTGGAPEGTLTATWDSGDTCTVAATTGAPKHSTLLLHRVRHAVDRLHESAGPARAVRLRL